MCYIVYVARLPRKRMNWDWVFSLISNPLQYGTNTGHRNFNFFFKMPVMNLLLPVILQIFQKLFNNYHSKLSLEAKGD